MRSCLIQIVIAAVVVFALLWFGLPLVANVLALQALEAAGFSGTNTQVQVVANPPPLLLTGHADSIHITSNQAGVANLHANVVDVTLYDVDLLSRRFGSVQGVLNGVSLAAPNSDAVSLTSVQLSGPSASAVAICTLTVTQTETLAESQLRSQGVDARVALVPRNRMIITVGGNSYFGSLEPENGSLYLVPDAGVLPKVLLMAPGEGNPFRITSVEVGDQDVVLTGTIDVQGLLT